MMLVRTRNTPHQVLILGIMLTLATLAWTASLLLPATPLAGAMVHGQGRDGLELGLGVGENVPATGFAALGLFLAAWTVMSAAMMLPTALPMVGTYAQLARPRPNATHRVLLFVFGYLIAWAGFGLVAYAADLLVHRAVRESVFLASHTSVLGGGVLVLAGVYQLTPLKRRCLRQCRSAITFLMSFWRDGLRGAWLMGVHHGVFCVGCCWALMLVMFGLGMAQLAWMLGLAMFMFVEKVARVARSRRVRTRPVAAGWLRTFAFGPPAVRLLSGVRSRQHARRAVTGEVCYLSSLRAFRTRGAKLRRRWP